MDVQHRLDRLRATAEQLAWQADTSGIGGAGRDETGIVLVRLDDAGLVREVEIGRTWWIDVGRDRLAAAVLDAINAAGDDRLAAWSRRVAERVDHDPPPVPRQSRPRESNEDVVPTDEVMRMLDLFREATAELDAYSRGLELRMLEQVQARSPAGRVSVTVAAWGVTDVDIDRRWLNERPAGGTIADDVRAACEAAYELMGRQESAVLATSPAMAAVRRLATNPVELLGRLGLGPDVHR